MAREMSAPVIRLAAGAQPLPAGRMVIGMHEIDIPPAVKQRQGFTTPHARRLMETFPGRFKLVRDKGD